MKNKSSKPSPKTKTETSSASAVTDVGTSPSSSLPLGSDIISLEDPILKDTTTTRTTTANHEQSAGGSSDTVTHKTSVRRTVSQESLEKRKAEDRDGSTLELNTPLNKRPGESRKNSVDFDDVGP